MLALVALLLVFVPDVPRLAAAVAALAFGLAALARAGLERRALTQLRASVDRVLLREMPLPWSPLLLWRCGELTSTEARERLAASIGRIERAAAAAVLPGSAPLNRGAVRAHGEALDAIADRLLLAEPVSARGVLLVRRLLDDPAGPLFDRDRAQELAGELRQALTALDERVRRTSR
jgi:hypothetical protein